MALDSIITDHIHRIGHAVKDYWDLLPAVGSGVFTYNTIPFAVSGNTDAALNSLFAAGLCYAPLGLRNTISSTSPLEKSFRIARYATVTALTIGGLSLVDSVTSGRSLTESVAEGVFSSAFAYGAFYFDNARKLSNK